MNTDPKGTAECTYNVDEQILGELSNLIDAFNCFYTVSSDVGSMVTVDVRLTIEQYDVINRCIQLNKWDAYCASIYNIDPSLNVIIYGEWLKRIKDLKSSNSKSEFRFTHCEGCAIKDICAYRETYAQTINKINSIGVSSLKNLVISCSYYRPDSSIGCLNLGSINQGVPNTCN